MKQFPRKPNLSYQALLLVIVLAFMIAGFQNCGGGMRAGKMTSNAVTAKQ